MGWVGQMMSWFRSVRSWVASQVALTLRHLYQTFSRVPGEKDNKNVFLWRNLVSLRQDDFYFSFNSTCDDVRGKVSEILRIHPLGTMNIREKTSYQVGISLDNAKPWAIVGANWSNSGDHQSQWDSSSGDHESTGNHNCTYLCIIGQYNIKYVYFVGWIKTLTCGWR